jgi:methylamine---glutamate N-methyltransferase subunit B
VGTRTRPRLQLGQRDRRVTVAPGALESAVLAVDLASTSVRELNALLHRDGSLKQVRVLNPGGKHSIAVGLDDHFEVEVQGHVGYYCAGMNKLATVRIRGNCGVGVGENMMSGLIEVAGSASQSAGASARGGLVVIRGDASARCGISLKGADIVVGGSVGHLSAFMAQKGCLVVCGDAGDALGDSLYEAHLYVRGTVASLGADCVEKEMRDEHAAELRGLLAQAHVDAAVSDFHRYGSARRLYNFKVDNLGAY